MLLLAAPISFNIGGNPYGNQNQNPYRDFGGFNQQDFNNNNNGNQNQGGFGQFNMQMSYPNPNDNSNPYAKPKNNFNPYENKNDF